MTSYFTAVVIVNETMESTNEVSGGYSKPVTVNRERKVTEVAHITVRADTLDDLKDKITAHVALV